MVGLIALALVACGRLGFEQVPGTDAPDIPPTAKWISPSGSDLNAGTVDAPWRTWSHALGQLEPGDMLVARDGTYTGSSETGFPQINCSATGTACGGGPCENGTEQAPIVVRAEHERQALIQGDPSSGAPLRVLDCSYWRVEGLRVEHDDFNTTAGPEPGDCVVVRDSDHVVLRRLLVRHPDRYLNTAAMILMYSTDLLVEETEVYDFHNTAVNIWVSQRVTMRRNYIHSRGYADIPGGYATNNPDMGDNGITANRSFGIIVENNIVEDVGGAFITSALWGDTGDTGAGDQGLFVGNIAIGCNHGFLLASGCVNEDPCVSPNKIARDNLYRDNVALGCLRGFYFRGGVNNRIENATVLDTTGTGVRFDENTDNVGVASTAYAVNLLVASAVAGVNGVYVVSHAAWGVDHANVTVDTSAYTPLDANVTASTSLDPQLGACRVTIPPASPMKAAGVGGADIGANITHRSVDGVLTDTVLWDPSSGAFPCGATVANITDANGCSDLHQRNAIDVIGCSP